MRCHSIIPLRRTITTHKRSLGYSSQLCPVHLRYNQLSLLKLVPKCFAIHKAVDVAIADNFVRPVAGVSKEERVLVAVQNGDPVASTCSVYRPAIPFRFRDEKPAVVAPPFVGTS